MGYGTTIIILTLCFSYGLSLAGLPSPFTEMADVFTSDAWTGTMTGVANETGGIQSGTDVTPNPFALFANIFSALFSFFAFPFTIWFVAGLPVEIAGLLSVVFLALYSLAIVSWFRSGGEL